MQQGNRHTAEGVQGETHSGVVGGLVGETAQPVPPPPLTFSSGSGPSSSSCHCHFCLTRQGEAGPKPPLLTLLKQEQSYSQRYVRPANRGWGREARGRRQAAKGSRGLQPGTGRYRAQRGKHQGCKEGRECKGQRSGLVPPPLFFLL